MCLKFAQQNQTTSFIFKVLVLLIKIAGKAKGRVTRVHFYSQTSNGTLKLTTRKPLNSLLSASDVYVLIEHRAS